MASIPLKDLIGRVVTRDCDNEQFRLLTLEKPFKPGRQVLFVIKGINTERRIHKIEWDNFCENYTIANS